MLPAVIARLSHRGNCAFLWHVTDSLHRSTIISLTKFALCCFAVFEQCGALQIFNKVSLFYVLDGIMLWFSEHLGHEGGDCLLQVLYSRWVLSLIKPWSLASESQPRHWLQINTQNTVSSLLSMNPNPIPLTLPWTPSLLDMVSSPDLSSYRAPPMWAAPFLPALLYHHPAQNQHLYGN